MLTPTLLLLLITSRLLLSVVVVESSSSTLSLSTPLAYQRQPIYRWYDAAENVYYYSATNSSPIIEESTTSTSATSTTANTTTMDPNTTSDNVSSSNTTTMSPPPPTTTTTSLPQQRFIYQQIAFYTIINRNNNSVSGNMYMESLVPLFLMSKPLNTSTGKLYLIVYGNYQAWRLQTNHFFTLEERLGFAVEPAPNYRFSFSQLIPTLTRLYPYASRTTTHRYLFSIYTTDGIKNNYVQAQDDYISSLFGLNLNIVPWVYVFSSPSDFYFPTEEGKIPLYAEYKSNTNMSAPTSILTASDFSCRENNANIISTLELSHSVTSGKVYKTSEFYDIYNSLSSSDPLTTVSWTVDVSTALNSSVLNTTTDSSQHPEGDDVDIDFYFAFDYSTFIDRRYYPDPIFRLSVTNYENSSQNLNSNEGILYFRPPDTTDSNSYPFRRFMTLGEKFTNLHKFSSNVTGVPSTRIKVSLELRTPGAYWGMYLYRIYILGVPRMKNASSPPTTTPPVVCPSIRVGATYSACGVNSWLLPNDISMSHGKTYISSGKRVYYGSVSTTQDAMYFSNPAGDSATWTVPSNWKEEVKSKITVEYCKSSYYYNRYFYPPSPNTFATFSFSELNQNNSESCCLEEEEMSTNSTNTNNNNKLANSYHPDFIWSNIADTTNKYMSSSLYCDNYTLSTRYNLKPDSLISLTATQIDSSVSSTSRGFFWVLKLRLQPDVFTSSTVDDEACNENLVDPGVLIYPPPPTPVPPPVTPSPWSGSGGSGGGSSSGSSSSGYNYKSSNSGAKTGAIVGGVIGGFVALTMIIFVVQAVVSRMKSSSSPSRSTGEEDETGGGESSSPRTVADHTVEMSAPPVHHHHPHGAVATSVPSTGAGYITRDYDIDQIRAILENTNRTNQNQDDVYVMQEAVPFGGVAFGTSMIPGAESAPAPPPLTYTPSGSEMVVVVNETTAIDVASADDSSAASGCSPAVAAPMAP